jgi:hypothetical protein
VKERRNSLRSKVLAGTTAAALTFALTAGSAFAAWPSFQGDNDNNGVITNGTPPITAPATSAALALPYSGSPWAGVDATSVIGDGYSYTLYNGGTLGACLAITELANPNPTPALPVFVLDPNAGNGFELSTPYLDTDSHTLYALTNAGGNWVLWSVDVSDPTHPGMPVNLATGIGQPNTPITSYTENGTQYLYFGTFTGSTGGSYYQYQIGGGASALTPTDANDDFYWAGATVVTLASESYVVFGSDSRLLYVQPVGSGFAASANIIKLVNLVNTAGNVRSSVAQSGDSVYFTSQGNSQGILWKIAQSDLLTMSTTTDVNYANLYAKGQSTSTPVISANGNIYVGTYSGFTDGTVEAYAPTGSPTGGPVRLATIYDGDPVQSSVIAYSDEDDKIDYVYFTTNSAVGAGYAYSFDGTNSTPLWSAGGTLAPIGSNGHYALQGFASDDGYLVYGDDSNGLYIFHS